METRVRDALVKASSTIEALIEENRRIAAELDDMRKEARARKLYEVMKERGYFGDDTSPDDVVTGLASSPKLDIFEQILPELTPQNPPWKVSGNSSVNTPKDSFEEWVMTGKAPD